MVIRIDTREQRQLEFGLTDVTTVRDTVPVFDYALDGDHTRFAIERKSLQDFVQSVVMQDAFGRELRKIDKACKLGFARLYYVVEADYLDVQKYPFKKTFKSGKVTPGFVYRRWRELSHVFGVHVIWAGDSGGAAHAIHQLLRAREEELKFNAREIRENIMGSPSDHAPQSPSKLHYLEQCPRYENRPGNAGPAAEEGTRLHAATETGCLTGLTSEQAHQVTCCLEYTKSLEKPGSTIIREVKLAVEDAGTWGTCDWLQIAGTHMDVVDYKFGLGSVPDAEVNPQGWAYVLGAWALPEAKDVKTATVHFLLPRRDEITTHTFHKDVDQPRMLARVGAIVARAQNPDAAPTPGSGCLYCGRKGSCPAFLGTALMAPKQAGIDIPAITHPDQIKSPAVLSNLLALAPQIEDWCSQIKQIALDRARNGEEIPGYTLAHRKGRRTIKDVLMAWDLCQQYGVPLKDFLPACSVAVGDLDKAIMANAEKKKGAETVRRVHTELKALGIETQDSEIDYLKKEK